MLVLLKDECVWWTAGWGVAVVGGDGPQHPGRAEAMGGDGEPVEGARCLELVMQGGPRLLERGLANARIDVSAACALPDPADVAKTTKAKDIVGDDVQLAMEAQLHGRGGLLDRK